MKTLILCAFILMLSACSQEAPKTATAPQSAEALESSAIRPAIGRYESLDGDVLTLSWNRVAELETAQGTVAGKFSGKTLNPVDLSQDNTVRACEIRIEFAGGKIARYALSKVAGKYTLMGLDPNFPTYFTQKGVHSGV